MDFKVIIIVLIIVFGTVTYIKYLIEKYRNIKTPTKTAKLGLRHLTNKEIENLWLQTNNSKELIKELEQEAIDRRIKLPKLN